MVASNRKLLLLYVVLTVMDWRKQKLGDEYTVIQNKVNEMYRDGLVD